MRIERHDDARTFFARVAPFLERREPEHNLLLGFRTALERDPHAYGPEAPRLFAVVFGDEVVGVATQTPPYNLVLSEMDDPRSVDALVAALLDDGVQLPGVLGPKELARRFADAWAEATGTTARPTLEQRVYAAEHALLPEGVAGRMRRYEPRDHELAIRWIDEFFAEALPGAPRRESADVVEHRALVFWEDGEPVSIAGYGSPTPNGVRIGPVYTPTHLRRRGYATALTAALTSELLGAHRFCFLFTDLANPTSNSIYQRIGYRPVGDVTLWTFVPS
jgi:uncharacterized protein